MMEYICALLFIILQLRYIFRYGCLFLIENKRLSVLQIARLRGQVRIFPSGSTGRIKLVYLHVSLQQCSPFGPSYRAA
jgi:hypothetical protein